jgi:hypothetical protein
MEARADPQTYLWTPYSSESTAHMEACAPRTGTGSVRGRLEAVTLYLFGSLDFKVWTAYPPAVLQKAAYPREPADQSTSLAVGGVCLELVCEKLDFRLLLRR